MNTDALTTTHVANMTGISYRMIDHVVRRGLLRPTHATDGSGTVRLWDVKETALALRLAEVSRATGLAFAATCDRYASIMRSGYGFTVTGEWGCLIIKPIDQ